MLLRMRCNGGSDSVTAIAKSHTTILLLVLNIFSNRTAVVAQPNLPDAESFQCPKSITQKAIVAF